MRLKIACTFLPSLFKPALLQASSLQKGRQVATLEDYRSFEWAKLSRTSPNVTHLTAAFLAPRLGRATHRLWWRGVSAQALAVFDVNVAADFASTSAAFANPLPIPVLPPDVAWPPKTDNLNASALFYPPPPGVVAAGPLSAAAPVPLPGTGIVLPCGHYSGACGPGHFSSWGRQLGPSSKVQSGRNRVHVGPAANQLVVEHYPQLVAPEWAGWVGGALPERYSLRDSGASFAVVFVAGPQEELQGSNDFTFRPADNSYLDGGLFWRRLATMHRRHTSPRVDSTAGLERWQTHVQHVLVARNGFPHGYFLPTPGPGALYVLSVEPIVSVAANNDVTGLIRHQCSESALCDRISQVGSHSMLAVDSGGVRFIVVSLASVPRLPLQDRSVTKGAFHDLQDVVAAVADDPATPTLIVAHVDGYFDNGGCDCECPGERHDTETTKPCWCDCDYCLLSARTLLGEAALAKPLTFLQSLDDNRFSEHSNSSCVANLAAFVLGNDAFFHITAGFSTSAAENQSAGRSLNDATSGHTHTPVPFCSRAFEAFPSLLLLNSARSANAGESARPWPRSVLCRW